MKEIDSEIEKLKNYIKKQNIYSLFKIIKRRKRYNI